MQDKLMQAQTQPFIKLAQANMELLSRFSSSPEMTTQANNMIQQATETSRSLLQSGAFAQMMQGMMKNYSEFFLELNQSNMALLGQSQAALVRQVQEAGEGVIDASDARVRRPRQAA